MQILYFVGYFLILLMGLVLGLTGGGGSILTLPILKYAFNFSTETAVVYSLFLVGFTSFFGTIIYAFKKQVDFKTGIIFSLPALAGVFLTRRFFLPIIPNNLNLGNLFNISKDSIILSFFIIIMLFSSYKMILGKTNNPSKDNHNSKKGINFLKSFSVGILTGLIGAGGGFIITPTLVLVFKLEIKKAIATSLFIISLNSLVGFFSSKMDQQTDWNFLLILLLIAFIGNLVGILLQKYISSKKLKKGFGYFILFISFFMILQEIF